MACCREDIGTPLENTPRPVRIYDSREDPQLAGATSIMFILRVQRPLGGLVPVIGLYEALQMKKGNYTQKKYGFSQADKEFLPRNIDKVVISQYVMCPWYFSPLPRSFASRTVYICEYCFTMLTTERIYKRHVASAPVDHHLVTSYIEMTKSASLKSTAVSILTIAVIYA